MGTNVGRKRGTTSKQDGDGSGRYFYLAIAGVFALGFGFNIWSRFAADDPDLDTFLDLLTIRKTAYCTNDGALLATPVRSDKIPNCTDYRGYRIIEGESVVIFEIATLGAEPQHPHYARVAELNKHALERLLNVKFDDQSFIPAKGRSS
jgi:hypothetical protein